MAKKQLTILIAILAVAVITAIIVKSTRSSRVQSADKGVGEKLLPELPVNDISRITIESADEALTLEKGGDEGAKWTVAEREGYPANFEKIRNLLIAMSEVKIAQLVEAGPSQFGRLQLISPGAEEGDMEGRGTFVTFAGEDDAALAELLLGKEYVQKSDTPSPFGGLSSTPAGRYVRVGDEASVWLVPETFSDIGLEAADWLSDDFFKVEKLKSVAISAKDAAFNWRLYREDETGADWNLANLEEGEELDAARVSGIRNAFSDARFDDVVLDKEAAGDEVTKIVLATFDGFVYEIEVGPELDEGRKHHLTMSVKAVFPEKREAEEGETEEEKVAKDEEFENELDRLKKKLEAEKAIEGQVYLVPNFAVSSLLKRRFELLKVEDETPTPGLGPGPAGGMPFPGAGGIPGMQGAGPLIQRPPGPTSPTPAPPKPRATAVTPPVGIENGKIISPEEIKRRSEEASKKLEEAAKGDDEVPAAAGKKKDIDADRPAGEKEGKGVGEPDGGAEEAE
jgi:hypothetical protein